ncbi:hypothetical protein [Desertivirga arenae]|uniref:hypothetical protein n=1 Tax=Desertivirga arenae TaxID=2810309 RepID=UPI001A975730|nr:hypothetical protein [Pedobacter sp. SYSU D00823]
MNTILNQQLQSDSDPSLLENFFKTYPPEKTEKILWRWLLASVKNDFTGISQDDMHEFSDFFEKLHRLEVVLQEQYNEQQSQLKKGESA